ncbi:MAG: cell envelope integrity protein CreD [Candidatus Cloacimonetes bacterium]|nr:cell envelope integrity protein CreD [Candidatus Cloacimonadota bacterium]
MNTEQIIKSAGNKSNVQIWKLLIIGFLILILMIPVAWISSIIRERYQRKESVVSEIAGKWGASQIVSGPFISIPYTALEKNPDPDSKLRLIELTKYIYLAPDSLQVLGKIKTVIHQRGIFKVTGYIADVDLNANFSAAIIDNPAYRDLPLRWDEALVSFDLDDQRGMKEISGTLNDQPLVFNRSEGVLSVSSLPETGDLKNTFSAYKGDAKEVKQTDFKLAAKVLSDIRSGNNSICIHMEISGTQQLNFASSALQEKVILEGDWLAPSFIGDMLPESRSIDSKGFKATWRTTNLNSGIKKLWSSDEPMLQLSNLGVNFLIMVDSYQQTTRALKYSVLFLLLTFMTFFFAETMAKQKIHPIQYLMVGCGLLVFYLLLLSISEHISFAWSYLIAATGVILQISMYCYSILKTRSFALKVGALLVFLYVFLYVLLRLQDSALLIGSISLFVLLSVAMYIIRNVNWYSQD